MAGSLLRESTESDPLQASATATTASSESWTHSRRESRERSGSPDAISLTAASVSSSTPPRSRSRTEAVSLGTARREASVSSEQSARHKWESDAAQPVRISTSTSSPSMHMPRSERRSRQPSLRSGSSATEGSCSRCSSAKREICGQCVAMASTALPVHCELAERWSELNPPPRRLSSEASAASERRKQPPRCRVCRETARSSSAALLGVRHLPQKPRWSTPRREASCRCGCRALNRSAGSRAWQSGTTSSVSGTSGSAKRGSTAPVNLRSLHSAEAMACTIDGERMPKELTASMCSTTSAMARFCREGTAAATRERRGVFTSRAGNHGVIGASGCPPSSASRSALAAALRSSSARAVLQGPHQPSPRSSALSACPPIRKPCSRGSRAGAATGICAVAGPSAPPATWIRSAPSTLPSSTSEGCSASSAASNASVATGRFRRLDVDVDASGPVDPFVRSPGSLGANVTALVSPFRGTGGGAAASVASTASAFRLREAVTEGPAVASMVTEDTGAACTACRPRRSCSLSQRCSPEPSKRTRNRSFADVSVRTSTTVARSNLALGREVSRASTSQKRKSVGIVSSAARSRGITSPSSAHQLSEASRSAHSCKRPESCAITRATRGRPDLRTLTSSSTSASAAETPVLAASFTSLVAALFTSSRFDTRSARPFARLAMSTCQRFCAESNFTNVPSCPLSAGCVASEWIRTRALTTSSICQIDTSVGTPRAVVLDLQEVAREVTRGWPN
mmetsp:Transcript_40062/g.85530  ORF Transcript_40062/g.85530 Transcript_40062/m.85530 type:complete len:744 (-) Transcript_40062:93-2324(-)